jgi:hypothetical protein
VAGIPATDDQRVNGLQWPIVSSSGNPAIVETIASLGNFGFGRPEALRRYLSTGLPLCQWNQLEHKHWHL